MTSDRFKNVIDEQIGNCMNILWVKAKEYATDDRLHNFKSAAGLMNCDPKEALNGMMVKHIVSVSDMCRDGKKHSMDIWNEKITDSINYLLLLKALIVEEAEIGETCVPVPEPSLETKTYTFTCKLDEPNNFKDILY